MELDQLYTSHHSTSSPKSTDEGKRRTHHKEHPRSADARMRLDQHNSNHRLLCTSSPADRKRRTHRKSGDGTMRLHDATSALNDKQMSKSVHDPSTTTIDLNGEVEGSNSKSSRWSSTPHSHHSTPSPTSLSPDDRKRRARRKERAKSADGRMRLNERSKHSIPSTTSPDDRKRRTRQKERANSADGIRMRLDQRSKNSKHNSSASPDEKNEWIHQKERSKSADGWEERHKHNHRHHTRSRSRHSKKSEETSKLHRLRRHHSWDLKDLKQTSSEQGKRQKEPLQLKSYRDLGDLQHKSFRDPRDVKHIGGSEGNHRSNVRQLDWVGARRGRQRHHFPPPDSGMSHSLHMKDNKRMNAMERQNADLRVISVRQLGLAGDERGMQRHHFSTPDSSMSHSLDMETVDRMDAMERQNEDLRVISVRQLDLAGERGVQRHLFSTPDSSMSHSLDMETVDRMDAMERQNEDLRVISVRQLDLAGERGMQRHRFLTPDSSMSHSLDMETVDRMERQNEDLRVRIGMLEIQRENDVLKTRIDKIESREVSVCSDEPSEHIPQKHKHSKRIRRQQRRLFPGWDDLSLKIRIIAILVFLLVVVGISALILSHPGDKDDGYRPLTDDDPIFSSTIFPVWMKNNDANGKI
ncbi:unnamed protein product [Cylindrotheca closterium]|uniref:Uncharacterized protein n=1 Tax=Cylindrotheca closterium TaxID=2856 RepID=A0AAD2JLT4_9STRA|nr:unnamed protein product [Cylindrotheca closterium]